MKIHVLWFWHNTEKPLILTHQIQMIKNVLNITIVASKYWKITPLSPLSNVLKIRPLPLSNTISWKLGKKNGCYFISRLSHASTSTTCLSHKNIFISQWGVRKHKTPAVMSNFDLFLFFLSLGFARSTHGRKGGAVNHFYIGSCCKMQRPAKDQ